jgi:hypothetical protein
MRTLAYGAAVLLGGTFLSTTASAQGVTCPTFSGTHSSGCGAIVSVTGTNATVSPGPASGPYDGSDDTLVGVVNNIPVCQTGVGKSTTVTCGISIYSLDLTSTRPICGFDSDGIDSYGAPSNSQDGTGYGGPNVYFTPIPPAKTMSSTACRVNFIKPIPPGGGTDYFSLEDALSAASTPCTKAINNSICDVTGANCGGNKPQVPSITVDAGSGRTTQIQATFIPQGIDPATSHKYTLAAAATVCGFTNFDWQQTITADPTATVFAIAAPTVALVAPYNDPPVSGYTYMQTWKFNIAGVGNNIPGPIDAPGVPVYYDPYNQAQAKTAAGDMTLAGNTNTAMNTLSFFDAPAEPTLPAGTTINFTTHLVGLGKGPTYPVIDTGMGFTWTSNNNGTVGGIAVTAVPKGTKGDPGGTGGVTVSTVTQTSTYTGVGVSAINGSTNIFGPTSLLSAVLPASRSAQPNGTITFFATIINTGATTATGCSIAPGGNMPGTFLYQTTNPATNALTGTANTPVDIPGNNGSQSFVVAFSPTAAIPPTDTPFSFVCTNTSPAPIVAGLNTLLLSASTTQPTADVIALAATAKNDGIVHVTGTPMVGAFAVATDNLGLSVQITVSATTGSVTLPVTITVCQTNPQTGACLQTPTPTVTTTINTNTTPTFAIFVAASAAVPFDPANNRIFVKFSDNNPAVRGETSVAVTTQ